MKQAFCLYEEDKINEKIKQDLNNFLFSFFFSTPYIPIFYFDITCICVFEHLIYKHISKISTELQDTPVMKLFGHAKWSDWN